MIASIKYKGVIIDVEHKRQKVYFTFCIGGRKTVIDNHSCNNALKFSYKRIDKLLTNPNWHARRQHG